MQLELVVQRAVIERGSLIVTALQLTAVIRVVEGTRLEDLVAGTVSRQLIMRHASRLEMGSEDLENIWGSGSTMSPTSSVCDCCRRYASGGS